MKLPKQAKPVMRNVSEARIEGGVNSSVNIGCLITKCAPCAAKVFSGNISDAVTCAMTNCPQCF